MLQMSIPVSCSPNGLEAVRALGKKCLTAQRKTGVLALEWILIFTLVGIGLIAAFFAMTCVLSQEQLDMGVMIDGMNFPKSP